MGLAQSSMSGSITSNKGVMGPHTPFLIVRRRANYNPTLLGSIEGLPVNGTYKLSACTGFVRVKEIHLRAVPATSDELDILESILKSGVHI